MTQSRQALRSFVRHKRDTFFNKVIRGAHVRVRMPDSIVRGSTRSRPTDNNPNNTYEHSLVHLLSKPQQLGRQSHNKKQQPRSRPWCRELGARRESRATARFHPRRGWPT